MTKIVLIGAGSLQFTTGMLGDIFTSDHLCEAEIVLNDINNATTKLKFTVASEFMKAHNLEQTLHVESDLRFALPGADFVTISIEVGDRFAHWGMDWKIPQQYNISQVYGENRGPGGLFYSLSIIPPILEIFQKIVDIAPDDTLFNY